MDHEPNYKISINGPGLSFEREISEQVAQEVLLWILTGKFANPPIHSSHPEGEMSIKSQSAVRASAPKLGNRLSTRGLSIGEYMDKHEPRRIPDKIATFALFLKEEREVHDFVKDDLVAIFREAAEPIPKNLGRDMKWTQTSGWIALTPGEKSQFYLTDKGEKAVQGSFPKEMVKATRLGQSSKRRKRRATSENGTSQPTEEGDLD